MKIEIIGDCLILEVDKEIYNQDTLHKCFYWYGASFDVDITNFSSSSFQIKLKPKDDTARLEEITSKIKRDLIDFKLRDIVTKETQTVRELIIAKAFAYYEEDDSPRSEITDPVGFNPHSI